MIYIDPPYNTGNDFIYKDDFSQSAADYVANSGQIDNEGNRLVQNSECNGRFHTDWLNMLYPRLRLAKDLLSYDGAIFISLDDGEQDNLKKICNEIFGEYNYRNTILVRRRIKSLNSQLSENGLYSMNIGFEYVLVYSKSSNFLMKPLRMKKVNTPYKGRWDVFWSNADRPTMRYNLLGFTPVTGQWRNSKEKADIAVDNYNVYKTKYEKEMTLEEYYHKTGISDFIRRIPNGTGKNGGVQHWIAPSDTMLRTSNWTDIEVSQIGKEIDIPFDNPKSKSLMMELIKLCDLTGDNGIVLDFFSGSATTAHAVMQLNAESGAHHKFILVQLPEKTEPKSDAFKAGYKTICDIGEERIRCAGKKIKKETGANIDYGFRCFKVDSSNMKDVYYRPAKLFQINLDQFIDNIKEDRTPEDLLVQVMLDLGVFLSSKVEKIEIKGKNVFSVADGYLIACFDMNVAEDVVIAIAKKHPYYAVFRDNSMTNDSVAANFDQIFNTYSPKTVRKVL